MSINQFATMAARLPLPDPTSDRPILFWSTLVDTITAPFQFTLNNNITFPIPNNPTSPFVESTCRAINLQVDLTMANENFITYMSAAFIPCTYFANYSGIHPIIHYGIISVGTAISQLQSGI